MARRPAKARHRPSSIDRLDHDVRELIGKLRMDHGWTIDEILQRLLDMGQSVSRSALGRHVRTLEDISAEMREAQAMATALAREVGDADQSRMLDVNAQLLQANMFKLMLAAREEDGEGVQLTAKDAKAFADALRSIALTRKTDLDLLERAEKRAADRAKAEAAENATRAARAKGLSKETVESIRFAVLGSDT
ncbi:phage protein Gp27 family protein [Sphingopyxis alaskensis]|uniref:phage protein Gp27 family protein n=1 Tax=Sphingopyxis alaskensis TaxID=117207 RepID=UPI00203D806A|nr:phage protein Gp27 family protein [Sphingopyxis alaskensis]MCM3419043.1 DUF3486 family protein [Sphingopyxis alaskensis]